MSFVIVINIDKKKIALFMVVMQMRMVVMMLLMRMVLKIEMIPKKQVKMVGTGLPATSRLKSWR